MGQIVLVSNGQRIRDLLAAFSNEAGAKLYIEELIKRYREGARLGLHDRNLAPELGNWTLGLGPTAEIQNIDAKIEWLPGVWAARLDTQCRIVACEFSLNARPHDPARIVELRSNILLEGFGRTPHTAREAAQKAVERFLRRSPRDFR
jgi:hypothetical protein